MNENTPSDQIIEVPGFPGRPVKLDADVARDPKLRAVILRNVQPDVFEKLLRADGRFSEKFFERYHRNLKAQGWEVKQ